MGLDNTMDMANLDQTLAVDDKGETLKEVAQRVRDDTQPKFVPGVMGRVHGSKCKCTNSKI